MGQPCVQNKKINKTPSPEKKKLENLLVKIEVLPQAPDKIQK